MLQWRERERPENEVGSLLGGGKSPAIYKHHWTVKNQEVISFMLHRKKWKGFSELQEILMDGMAGVEEIHRKWEHFSWSPKRPLKGSRQASYWLSPSHVRCIWFLLHVGLNLILIFSLMNAFYIPCVTCTSFYLILAMLKLDIIIFLLHMESQWG